MALLRHRLPRIWLGVTLGGVLTLIATAFWWERQLPNRLQQAEQRGDLVSCLRYSEQLAALSWLPGSTPLEVGRCRRQRALQLWQQGRLQEALSMQNQLLLSPAGSQRDRQRLTGWQQSLRRQAMEQFQGGQLDVALRTLAPLGEDHRGDGTALGDEFRQIWDRNRIQLDRATRLSQKARWWEALDALNRIDHPWWKTKSVAVRRRVNQGIERLKGAEREHDAHGELPHTVPVASLDAAVQRRIAAGMDDWKAFEQACKELGGRIVEAGPDSSCQR
ncbi:MAG: hypothetical protein VKI42_07020 [Synechococcaceae cyanobacterium]|nr:hypothetical protein [Synechococcaceae cyanobacterium]